MLKKLEALKEKAKRGYCSSNLDPSKLDDKVTFYQSAIYAYTVDELHLLMYVMYLVKTCRVFSNIWRNIQF